MSTADLAAPPGMSPSSAVTARVITDIAELERLRPGWADLMDRGVNEPALAPDWVLTWWRVFGKRQGRRLRAVVLESAGRLVGLALLLLRRHWQRGVLPLQRLEFLGSGEPERDSICSPYLNVIVERGWEAIVARDLIKALVEGRLGAWHELVFTMMAGDDPTANLLVEACRQRGLGAVIEQTAVAPYIPLPATWDEYLRRHTRSHRKFLTRSLRDFEDWAGADIAIQRVREPAELAPSQATLIDLHQRRWGDQGGVFCSPSLLAFHAAIQPLLLARGALDLRVLRVRGQPVAAMYSIVWNAKVYYYQCGRRPDLPPTVRPGIYLLAQAIKDHIKAGQREFDFLPGAAQYKTELAQATRPIVEIRVHRPGIRTSILRTMEQAIGWLRRHQRLAPPTPRAATVR